LITDDFNAVAKELASLLDEGTLAERRIFLKIFIKEIKVTGD